MADLASSSRKSAKSGKTWQKSEFPFSGRVTMEPRRQESLHSVDATQLDEIVMRPLGYQWSAPMSVPKLEDVPEVRPVSALDRIRYRRGSCHLSNPLIQASPSCGDWVGTISVRARTWRAQAGGATLRKS